MILWKSFGASVAGPGHIAAGIPNQDSWFSFHHAGGDGIVVSDGLGSKPLSHFGSQAAGFAVEQAYTDWSNKTKNDLHFLFNRIKANWLSRIAPLEPRDCATTCLFALRIGNGSILLGMLGDGLASILKRNGSVVSLMEDKSEGFSNVTSALSPNTSSKDWQHLSLREDECAAILLCTDGVADDLVNVDDFVRGYIEEHRILAAVSANRRSRIMLERWSTPKHSDDKTIACLHREEVEDE